MNKVVKIILLILEILVIIGEVVYLAFCLIAVPKIADKVKGMVTNTADAITDIVDTNTGMFPEMFDTSTVSGDVVKILNYRFATTGEIIPDQLNTNVNENEILIRYNHPDYVMDAPAAPEAEAPNPEADFFGDGTDVSTELQSFGDVTYHVDLLANNDYFKSASEPYFIVNTDASGNPISVKIGGKDFLSKLRSTLSDEAASRGGVVNPDVAEELFETLSAYEGVVFTLENSTVSLTMDGQTYTNTGNFDIDAIEEALDKHYDDAGMNSVSGEEQNILDAFTNPAAYIIPGIDFDVAIDTRSSTETSGNVSATTHEVTPIAPEQQTTSTTIPRHTANAGAPTNISDSNYSQAMDPSNINGEIHATSIQQDITEAVDMYLNGNSETLFSYPNANFDPNSAVNYQYEFDNRYLPLVYDSSTDYWWNFIPTSGSAIVVYSTAPIVLTDRVVTIHYGDASDGPAHYTFNEYQVQAIENTRKEIEDSEYANTSDLNRDSPTVINGNASTQGSTERTTYSDVTAPTSTSTSTTTSSSPTSASNVDPNSAEMVKARKTAYDIIQKATKGPDGSINISGSDFSPSNLDFDNMVEFKNPITNNKRDFDTVTVEVTNITNADSKGNSTKNLDVTCKVSNKLNGETPYILVGYIIDANNKATKVQAVLSSDPLGTTATTNSQVVHLVFPLEAGDSVSTFKGILLYAM